MKPTFCSQCGYRYSIDDGCLCPECGSKWTAEPQPEVGALSIGPYGVGSHPVNSRATYTFSVFRRCKNRRRYFCIRNEDG